MATEMTSAAGDSQFAGDGCVLRLPDVVAFLRDRELGPGLLSVEESALSWTSDDQSEKMVLEYPNICIHAVCRDTSSFPHECVYLLHSPPGEGEGEGEEEEEEEEEFGGKGEDKGGMMEMRLVPRDPSQLDAIYQAISDCQLLYPDLEQPDSDEEEEGEEGELGGVEEEEEEGEEMIFDPSGGEFFTTPEGLQHLTPDGQRVLEHLENILTLPSPEQFAEMVANGSSSTEGQFEDAD